MSLLAFSILSSWKIHVYRTAYVTLEGSLVFVFYQLCESEAMALGGLAVALIVADTLLRRLILPLALLSGKESVTHMFFHTFLYVWEMYNMIKVSTYLAFPL